MKKIQLMFGALFIFVAIAGIISAEDAINESSQIDVIGNFTAEEIILNNSNVEEANCSEQLSMCVDEYNSLLSDFRNRTNCGLTDSSMLRSMNTQLGEERDICNEELKKANTYKTGFFLIFTILLITGILIIIRAIRK